MPELNHDFEHLPPFDRWLEVEFKEAYKNQVEIFARVGLLELLPECGEMGIRGIDGKEYPIPSKEKVKAEMMKNKEMYEKKMAQGFTQIQFTPFGVPLEKLTTILEQRILAHHKDGKLFATKEKPTDPDEPLELDTTQPLFKWDGWIDPNAPEGQRGADASGKCLYHVKTFDEKDKGSNYGGYTKAQILDIQSNPLSNSPFPGWEVKLMEPSANIPREGKGKTVKGRKQLETNKTLTEYLNALQTDPQYGMEEGLTNEDWITQFIIHLEKTNQVIDDYEGKGSASFLSGSFNQVSRGLGCAYWSRVGRRARLGRRDPGARDSVLGLRSAVGVGQGVGV